MYRKIEIIVVGGGHAGVEAAMAAARMGVKTLLLTHNIANIGQMSCNPSIGGIGKGHLVKEIDALGGIMASAADKSGIQFRILNASKGPAVRATRAQVDRILYKQVILEALQSQKNLYILQQTVDDLIIEQDAVKGIITNLGIKIYAKSVLLTVGTFLNGKIYTGLKYFQGGRVGDPPSIALANKLRSLPFRVNRLKTGTPPRLDGSTIDYSELKKQLSNDPLPIFSFSGSRKEHPRQMACYITHTNEKTHEIIRDGLDQSPLYTKIIETVGPRYCPSIEDKVIRFADKASHQIFIEPEGLHTSEVYPNGISTSLSYETQIDFIRSIKGFENAYITSFGYAIEYDFFDPRDLKYSLETKSIKGLFFAGQINGTTGYEEAAAQGLIAGINAALQIKEENIWYPRRDEGYIGVMLDDLITCGTKEPYRMFTSRAEYRLLLREDNADLRLTKYGRKFGLIDHERWEAFEYKRESIKQEKQRLYKSSVVQSDKDIKIDPLVAEQVKIQMKYDGYIKRQLQEIAKCKKHENTKIPNNFDYDKIKSLSNEIKQKFKEIRPLTIGQAARIPGVTPASISLLLVFLKV